MRLPPINLFVPFLLLVASCSSEAPTVQQVTEPSVDASAPTEEGSSEQASADAGNDTEEAAGAEPDAEGSTDAEQPDADEPAPPSGPVDITNAKLVSTDANCLSYVGSYASLVTDVQTGTAFEGELTISGSGDNCTLVSNQIPNHEIGGGANFASEVDEVASTWVIPTVPQVNNEPTDLGFTVHAVMLNGVIWEAYPAACYGEGPSELGREAISCGGNQLDNPWRYNVGSALNAFQLDDYSAHTQPGGLYHYHSTPPRPCTRSNAPGSPSRL